MRLLGSGPGDFVDPIDKIETHGNTTYVMLLVLRDHAKLEYSIGYRDTVWNLNNPVLEKKALVSAT